MRRTLRRLYTFYRPSSLLDAQQRRTATHCHRAMATPTLDIYFLKLVMISAYRAFTSPPRTVLDIV